MPLFQGTTLPTIPLKPLEFKRKGPVVPLEFGDTSAPDFSFSEDEDSSGALEEPDRSMFADSVDFFQDSPEPDNEERIPENTEIKIAGTARRQSPSVTSSTSIPGNESSIPDQGYDPFDVDYFLATKKILPTPELLKRKKDT